MPSPFDARFMELLDASSDAVFACTPEGVVFRGNRRAAELFGYAQHELVGMHRSEFIAQAPQLAALTDARMRVGIAKGELEYLRRDGSRFVGAMTAIEEGEGPAKLVWVLIRDLSAERAAAAATAELRDSNEMFRALSDAAFEAVLMHSQGQIRMANRAAEQYVGLGPGGMIGRNLLEFIAPECHQEILAKIAAGDDRPYDAVARRVDGSLFPVEAQVRTVPVELANESLRVCAVRDLTDRRALEQQLRQAQKMEAIGLLAAGVAHDFNNLLSVILGATELACMELGDGHPSREDLDAVMQAGRRASELTRQLLAFGRKQVLQVRVIDVGCALADMHNMLRHALPESIELQLIIDPAPARVRVDPVQLEQAVLNLVLNARDAMADGGRLTIHAERRELDEPFTRDHLDLEPGHHVLITVVDTGHGMDAELRSHIFEPFFTTKGPGRGTGLGLSTVFGIVKQSGGSIWVDSEPGKGARFVLCFPATTEAGEPEPERDEPPHELAGQARVLVVEDEPQVRRVIVEVLRRAGYRVREAEGPIAALELLAQLDVRPELLLTDLVMPQMSGKQLADRVQELYGPLPVLYTSGYAEDGIIHRGGVLDRDVRFLAKPIVAAALLDAVATVLGEHQQSAGHKVLRQELSAW